MATGKKHPNCWSDNAFVSLLDNCWFFYIYDFSYDMIFPFCVYYQDPYMAAIVRERFSGLDRVEVKLLL